MADEAEEHGGALTAEGSGASLGEAKWSAIKALEPTFPGIEAEDVEFEVLDEGDEEAGREARVSARVLDPGDWEEGGAASELPDEAAERVRAVVARVTQALGLRASVEVVETDDEIAATVNGEDLGLLIGKHGATIDALQHLAARIAFRGETHRKSVTIDAAGYRERREAALQRAADQAVEDALSYGRAVELEPMSAAERRIVHTYLRDRSEVATHSEGDEPDRRLVVSPVRSSAGG
ncbi:MAG: spoIIIJ-associated protein [Thermoleophilaceae bacterium]|jgi:spoIIIJ-associated protein|nr:spoIIIJ-associated protein [Thermoleophilaceae bacterium]